MVEETIQTDVLVIGAGIAGIRAAIEACDHGAEVVLVTKGKFGRDCGATWMASVGYQCWGLSPEDTLDMHVEDTLRCGCFLNNQENIYAFLAHVPDTVRELVNWGGKFKMKDGQLEPIWQLGCSVSRGRSIYPKGFPNDKLGYMFSQILPRIIQARRRVRTIEDFFVIDLLTAEDAVVGALGIDLMTGTFKLLQAKATILATGGYQGLYPTATANPNLTGDGHAMALRAGVDMMDFEFNQTLPRAIWPPALKDDPLPFNLIWDSSWSGRMYNSDNDRFIEKWDPVKMERTTRALISRAIFHEIKNGKASPHGGIFTGVTHLPKHFIQEYAVKWSRTPSFIKLEELGMDLSRDYIETGYALHYCQGGCNVNTRCETDKPGLYAIGEVASGSKDGSDRMMSNALPYCMTMGIISGREAAARAKNVKILQVDESQVTKLKARALAPLKRSEGVNVYQAKPQFQKIITEETGYGRTGTGLSRALREIEIYRGEILPKLTIRNKAYRLNLEWTNALEFENLVLVAECIVRNALMRTESRGLHDRWDFPSLSPDWLRNIHLRLRDGELRQRTTPVEFTYRKPDRGSLGEPTRRGVQVKDYQGWQAEPIYRVAAVSK